MREKMVYWKGSERERGVRCALPRTWSYHNIKHMTQKQILGLAVGVLGVGVLFAFVYQQFSKPAAQKEAQQAEEQSRADLAKQEKQAALPVTIDDISVTIKEEATMDLSALEDEANGEISEIDADSESVTRLGTSYDENSL